MNEQNNFNNSGMRPDMGMPNELKRGSTKRQSKLLKVMAILFLVFGVIGVFSSMITVMALLGGGSAISELYANMGMSIAVLKAIYIYGAVVSVVQIVIGIVGLVYPSRKAVLNSGFLYLILVVINIVLTFVVLRSTSMDTDAAVQTGSTIGVIVGSVFSLIFPVLYLWGGYQSE